MLHKQHHHHHHQTVKLISKSFKSSFYRNIVVSCYLVEFLFLISFAAEREDVQKKTFTKWMNSQLSRARRPMIRDLVDDMRDGTQLLSLLEVLTGQVLVSRNFGGCNGLHNETGQQVKDLREESLVKTGVFNQRVIHHGGTEAEFN